MQTSLLEVLVKMQIPIQKVKGDADVAKRINWPQSQPETELEILLSSNLEKCIYTPTFSQKGAQLL